MSFNTISTRYTTTTTTTKTNSKQNFVGFNIFGVGLGITLAVIEPSISHHTASAVWKTKLPEEL